MKKLSKINLLFSFIPLTSTILTSCGFEQKAVVTKNDVLKVIQQPKKFDHVITDFASKYFFDNKTSDLVKNDFYLKQKAIDKSIYGELNVSLTFAPLFFPKVLTKAIEYNKALAINSINIIEDTLNNNWFWYLLNFKNFTYVYNDFDTSFKDFKNGNKDDLTARNNFINVFKQNKTLLFSFKDFEFQGLSKPYEFHLTRLDTYKYLKLVFIEIKNNKTYGLIPAFIYSVDENQQKNILLTGDIFVFDNLIGNFETKVDELALNISQARKHYIDADIEYHKKVFDEEQLLDELSFDDENKDDSQDDDTDKSDITQSSLKISDIKTTQDNTKPDDKNMQQNKPKKQFDDTSTLMKWIDKRLLKIYDEYSYFDSFYKAINEFNNKNKDHKIKRYTWSYINEN